MNDTDTRTRLLDAAQDLVQSVGANGMSYQDLSEVVGIRKASIHHHFPTKSSLLVALVDRYSARFLELVVAIQNSSATGATKLKRYCKLFEATLDQTRCRHACPCGMLGAEIATMDPPAAERLRAFYLANTERVATMLEEGKRDGSLRFEGDPRTLAWMLFSLLEGAMLVVRVEGQLDLFRKMLQQFQRLVSA